MAKRIFIFLSLVAFSICSFAAIEVIVKFPKTANAGENFIVEISISKDGAEGIARLKQEIPVGFIATPIATESADFSVENNTVRFIWKDLPNTEKIKISYNVKIDKNIVGKIQFGKGDFSFVKGSKPSITIIEAKSIQINKSEKPTIPEVITKPETKVVAETPKKPTTSTTSGTTPTTPKTTTSSTTKTTNETKTPAPKGIYFRVQFQAANTPQNIEEIKTKLAIKEPIYEELIDAYYKYTFGNFTSLDQANQQNTAFKQRTGTSSFIVAYENGKRITVKEALEKIKK